jgi:bifunctional UDP-N-acetylglucosamine pyrophosphorylase/glucosamine-1-phosphate N-acetyltransferase
MNLSVIILAAGEGTRMQSTIPKVLHQVASRPLIGYVIELAQEIKAKEQVMVVGPNMQELETYAQQSNPQLTCIVQQNRRGTADAVKVGLQALQGDEDVLVLYGDTPFISKASIESMYELLQSNPKTAVVVLGFAPRDPAQYGRLVVSRALAKLAHGSEMQGATERRNASVLNIHADPSTGATQQIAPGVEFCKSSSDDDSELLDIVEFVDCTPEQRMIDLCNSGVMLIRKDLAHELLASIKPDNAKKEYYLTDLVKIARQRGLVCAYVEADEFEAMSVNNKVELAIAEVEMQGYLKGKFLRKGVTLIDPDTVHFAFDTDIEPDVIVQPYVFFGPEVQVKSGSVIKSFSHLEGATVGADSVVGPFARLRPGTILEDDVKIGNFVEVKNSRIHQGAKVSHLSYIGDAELGRSVNIGAGTITCNYDGFAKHKTVIADRAFIGSNTALVAPVTIGEGAIIGAGSVITRDVAPDDLGIARSEQRNLSGKAAQMRAVKRKNH